MQHLELDAARAMADTDAGEPLRVLVLYGSLRKRSYSKLLAYEFARCGSGACSCGRSERFPGSRPHCLMQSC